MEYNFSEIESEVKEFWKKHDVYHTEIDHTKPKYYALDFFPYPSGAGLHVGHPLGYIACDIYARYKRLKGYNVLHPMGFDSFGLPAEQYAIQTGQHPAITTEKNIETFKEQLDKIGLSYDWSREVKTHDPDFYKWTQWIFIRFFHSWYNKKTDKAEPIASLILEFEQNGNEQIEAATDQEEIFSTDNWKGFSAKKKSDVLLNYRIAYLADSWVNWCPALGTVLANDEVKDGVSERGGYPVERKLMKQWSLRITAYAERLLQNLKKIDWPIPVKEMQENWIGKSEGSSVRFKIKDSRFKIEVFTTRPDTIFGSTFITLAPEHELVEEITTPEYKKQVDEYVTYAKNRSERDRMTDVKKITGQFTGAYAIHPFTQKEIPIWIGEYVLATYGTGAVMGVPGHDERDHRFAKHFGLDIISILEGVDVSEESFDEKSGTVSNSDFLNGLSVPDAIQKAIDEIEKQDIGKRKVNYKLRDAIFGRQRYWGEPIPVYYDEENIPHTVAEEDLPVVLPEVDKYLPTETGEPPLARAKDWTYTPPLSNSPRRGEDPLAQGTQDSNEFGFETADKLNWGNLKEYSRENRKKPTEAESILWQHLRKHQLGEHFRRQHAIGKFIADFVCLKKKLIVEVDGGIHDTQIKEDKGREEEFEKLGFTIIRFRNEEVTADLENVLKKIREALEKPFAVPGAMSERKSPLRGDLEGRQFPLETTTMPGWAGSNWYYLRYEDPHNENALASKDAIDYWQNMDLYLGGDEHATGHLMYFRFCTKFLFDIGIIPFDEPAKKLVNQGKIQGVSQKAYSPKGWSYGGALLTESIFEFFDMGFPDQPELRQLIADIRIPVEVSKKDFSLKVFFSADLVKTEEGLYKQNLPSQYVENNLLDIPRYIKYGKEEKKQLQIFVCQGGYWIDEVYHPRIMASKDFLTLPEVGKMSKSLRNVVNPDEVVEKYGADAFRLYEMFLGPLEQSKPWDTKGIDGCYRFLKKFWKLFYSEEENLVVTDEDPAKDELKILHRTIRKAGDDIEAMSFNTSVSAFMICVNELSQLNTHKKKILEPLLIILSPFAPFITEKLWKEIGNTDTIVKSSFPKYDESLLVENSFEYPVAVNGKTRSKINLPLDLTQEQVETEVLSREELKKYFDGRSPKKVVYVKGRMINVVV